MNAWDEAVLYYGIAREDDDGPPPAGALARGLAERTAMVDAASVLVACPGGPERQRSGTWSTVRYARRLGREVVIVWPDGRVEREVGRG